MSFSEPIVYTGANTLCDFDAADFNQDGRQDLVLLGWGETGIMVVLGDGGGGFQGPITTPSSGGSCRWIAVGDFTGDGKVDLVQQNNEQRGSYNVYQIALYAGNGDGTFQRSVVFESFTNGYYGLVPGDFNNDGALDLLARIDGSVHTFLNDGSGKFADITGYSLDTFGSLPVGDLDEDGRLDVAIANWSTPVAALWSWRRYL